MRNTSLGVLLACVAATLIAVLLPLPFLVSNQILPLWSKMILSTIDKPNPVPCPVGFVVKKGLNILSITSWGIPVPLSRILISIRPSLGVNLMALETRLVITISRRWASPQILCDAASVVS